jgi:hypothetical protein
MTADYSTLGPPLCRCICAAPEALLTVLGDPLEDLMPLNARGSGFLRGLAGVMRRGPGTVEPGPLHLVQTFVSVSSRSLGQMMASSLMIEKSLAC